MEVEGREVNEQNTLQFKSAREGVDKLPSIDRALQGPKPIESETPSIPSLVFEGIADTDNIPLIGGRVAPSDQNIDVGRDDVVQTVNDAMRIWDKNGVPKTSAKLISSLFSNLKGPCSFLDRGDPVVLYDRMADRWFVTQFAFFGAGQAPPFHQCVAVSQNGDPQGVYYTYDFVTPGAEFPDYGKFGVWPDGYYMTVNQFTEPGDNFNGVGMYALDRKKMLVGDPTASFIYFNRNGTDFPEFYNSTLPSDQDGLEAPPPGAPNVFAYLISDEFEIPPYNKDALRLFDFHADFVNPGNSTFIERPESPVLVAPFDPRSSPGRSDIKQPPPAVGTDSLDDIQYHLMYRLQYRNRGGIETLVSSTTVNVSGVTPTNRNLYQAGVRYFQLQRSSPGAPFLLYDNATFSPDAGNPATGVNRWLPSAAIDQMGNLAVSYSASSTTVFPSIWYAGRDFNALGGLTGELHLFDGTAVQLGSSNRWGDYQSLQLDPADDCTFWTTNQYYNTNSSFNWKTKIGRFKFPTCFAPAQGTVSGTITACDSGVGISGAVVQLSNGFSGTTDVNGNYSFIVQPGTYTVTAANGNRNCQITPATTVTVTDGGTTAFSACLSGTANPVIDSTVPNFAAISGGNGNGFIDPNECNTLNVTVRNQGCAPARNVTSVLSTSTPGVTITQSTSPYPDMVIDATGTNTTPFQVSTSPAFVCGTTVHFTVVTTYPGGSSTSVFDLPTCGPTAALPDVTVNFSLDPNDAKTANGRLGRDGAVSNCTATTKQCPGALGTGGRSYDEIAFANAGGAPACTTITLTSPNGAALIAAAYQDSFNPTDFCENYLGDPGGSANPTTAAVSWNVQVPPLKTLVVVVMEVNAGTPATPYTVKESGLMGPPLAGGGECPRIQFSASSLTVSEGGGAATLTINRTGISSGVATVDYATQDGTATQKGDYTIKRGTLTFADGETTKTLEVPIVDDVFVEGDETFTVTLSNVTGTGVTLTNATTTVTITDNDTVPPTANPIDDAGFFVRQQYLDFLNRQPDAAGLAFWTASITACGTDAACIAFRRAEVSAAFFLSIEFQETGGFAIRTQRAAFGRKSAEAATRLTYLELISAQSRIGDGLVVGQPGWEAKLAANQTAYLTDVVNSAAFVAKYPTSLTADAYVDALFASADVTPTAAERSAAIAAFGAGGTAGRVEALRSITDSASLRNAEINSSFVLMEYFGYLRRNPTDPPDLNDDGYQFWLEKLNSFNGDFRQAEMVKAFITSLEYRLRFGP
ncbi:MAG TPA: Calx-beta domain-containing protein [Pyrinomonadaceae bacterium]|nr:Calx-beta domain-containing protein [Pyrinomonadaceae bacterium]